MKKINEIKSIVLLYGLKKKNLNEINECNKSVITTKSLYLALAISTYMYMYISCNRNYFQIEIFRAIE